MDSTMILGTRDRAMSLSFGTTVPFGATVPFGTTVPFGATVPCGEWIAVEQRKPAQSALETANRIRLRAVIGTDVPILHPLLTSAAEP